jgi:RND family efflux transporter MFP subunit
MNYYFRMIIGSVIIAFCLTTIQAAEKLSQLSQELPIRVVFFPFRESTISTRVDSVILKYNYREGELFKANAILVELDSSRYKQHKNQVAAEYSEAQAQVIYFTKLYQSNLDLFKQGMQGEQMIAKNRLDMDTKKSDVIIVKAKLQLAELNVAACSIVAPFAGRMGSKTVKEHEFVRTGQPMFSIIDDNQLLAVVNIPQKLLKQIKIGKTMEIRLDDRKYSCRGKVYEISPTLDYSSGTFEVKILIDNSKHILKAGMTGILNYKL